MPLSHSEEKQAPHELPAEIERKFLVQRLPEGLDRYERSEIVQGYLFLGAADAHVRLRQKGKARLLTVKRGQGTERVEVEIELQPEQFDALWPLTEGRRVTKTRYRIPYDGRSIELDLYHEALEGHAVAEVEFATREEAVAFQMPDWFGEDVTDNRRFGNYRLARRGWPGD